MSDLRKIVADATPGPWALEFEHLSEWETSYGAYDVLVGIGPFADGPVSEWTPGDAAFIATFDPQMVSALLDVAEHALNARDLGHIHEGTQLSAALDRFRQISGLPDDRKAA